MDWTMTFSSMVLRRGRSWETPMPMIAMGIAASMPCPSYRAT
jgi:hypothetical protein